MKVFILILCGLSWSFILGIWAQEESKEDPAHNALRAMRDEMLKALESKDIATLAKHLHPNVVYTNSADVYKGKDAVQIYFEEMLKNKVKVLKVNFKPEALTELFGEDTGICYGTSVDEYEMVDGVKYTLNIRWTCTLVKELGETEEGDRWLVASFHYSANIFDNPLMKDLQQKFIFSLGGIGVAFFVALILGLIVGKSKK
jgi:ketosteroid isomerase-like protein